MPENNNPKLWVGIAGLLTTWILFTGGLIASWTKMEARIERNAEYFQQQYQANSEQIQAEVVRSKAIDDALDAFDREQEHTISQVDKDLGILRTDVNHIRQTVDMLMREQRSSVAAILRKLEENGK